MKTYLLEQAEKVFQSENNDHRKMFLEKLDDLMSSYLEMRDSLAHQAKVYEIKARELEMFRNVLHKKEPKDARAEK